MKTKTLKKNKVNVITLGCSKNLFDSEVTMTQLKANGFEVEHESEQNDSSIVIINTCGFIDNAKQESIDTILEYAQAKKDGLLDKLYVTGCLSERYKDNLETEIKEVDAFFGTRELPKLLKTLNADYKHELIGERIITTPSHYAYLKISEGCDRPCSFCAIPLMRGKHLSTPIEQLVEQAKNLAKQGVKELILIAQELTFYGLDIYKERKLSALLEELCKVEGIEWIRLHYAYPTGFPMEVIETMKNNPKICNYLDIPLQHASNNMLKAMRRGTTRENTTQLVNDIRALIPNIAIRTTFIVGFPGETKADIEEMKDWVKEMKFDRLGVFTYSHEENTHAFGLKDDVSEKEKQRRAAEVMELQQGISLALNESKIGKSFKVLFDRVESDYFVGRTEFDSPEVDNEVLVEKATNFVRIGDFAMVKITGADDFDLYGEVIINE
ncbi:MAG: 30S ribosomal protein S12 methylthiotransferase RimO [Flavobacteriales bacterium]|nr:30S ribosomal protein S12 methylthiotransferase RimO [Flavobacteriales bacterium]